MWLVVGLGNPGPQYATTRHNIGFMALDAFLKGLSISNEKNQFNAQFAKFKLTSPSGKDEVEIITLKPQTYMNKSGESVKGVIDFYKIPLSQVIVVHDDIDQPYLGMKIQKNRGHGGQNGVRNISELLGTADYARIKMGIGRPPHPDFPVADYVLGKFTNEQFQELMPFLDKAGDAIESIIFDGLQKASTKFNS